MVGPARGREQIIGDPERLAERQGHAAEHRHGLVSPPAEGTPGRVLLGFAGTMDDESARQMMEAIEESFERVDLAEWYHCPGTRGRHQHTGGPGYPPSQCMRDLYDRLKERGFDPSYLRSFVLPEWWTDDMADTESNRALAEAFIAKQLASASRSCGTRLAR